MAKYKYKNTDIRNVVMYGVNEKSNNDGYTDFPGLIYNGLYPCEYSSTLGFKTPNKEMSVNRRAEFDHYTSGTGKFSIPSWANHLAFVLVGGGGGGGGGGVTVSNNWGKNDGIGGGGGGGGAGQIIYTGKVLKNEISNNSSYTVAAGGAAGNGTGGKGNDGQDGGVSNVKLIYNNGNTVNIYSWGGNGGTGGAAGENDKNIYFSAGLNGNVKNSSNTNALSCTRVNNLYNNGNTPYNGVSQMWLPGNENWNNTDWGKGGNGMSFNTNNLSSLSTGYGTGGNGGNSGRPVGEGNSENGKPGNGGAGGYVKIIYLLS